MDSSRANKEPQSSTWPFARLLELPRGVTTALLHSGANAPALLFSEPVSELRREAGEWSGSFDALDSFLARHEDRKCVGFLGYDLRDDVEPVRRTVADEFPWPCMHVAAFDRVEEWWPQEVPEPPPVVAAESLHAHTSRADYEARIERVVELICAGDIFQANLTQPFTASFDGDPRLLFWKLCHESPAPFAAYYETVEGESVLCSSPEEFLFVDDHFVRTRPIKGTRPRSDDAAEDRRLMDELLASEKDQAELAMIVDLLRNDLGKIAETGSVRVGQFPEHQSFAQVHHTFATVTARARPEVSLVDLLRATFPSGSITGAPKLRTMEVIEELELVRRGIYTGAIGWFGPGHKMHLNVAIRTMAFKDGRVRFNTGGGITADSVPALEYEETLHKALGMVRALATELETP
jgi:para-aminobenzoate synthetase component I